MSDYGPLPPCPRTKTGRHTSVMMPMGEHVDASGPMFAVWACGNCGTMRVIRVDHDERPLDDIPASEIVERMEKWLR